MKFPLFLCLFASVSGIAKFNDNQKVIIKTETSVQTKRIWVNVTNNKYLSVNSKIYFCWKDSLFSSNYFKIFMTKLENWKGVYYYADIPLDCSVFSIKSYLDDKCLAETNWKAGIFNSRLCEVYSGSDIVRFRKADVYCPDAYVLGVFLSGYFLTSLYENGYSAYQDIQNCWINNYAGPVKNSLENTFIYDYETNDVEFKEKTRLISVQEKINELKNAFEKGPLKDRRFNDYESKYGVIGAVISIVVGLIITLILTKKRKYKYEQNSK